MFSDSLTVIFQCYIEELRDEYDFTSLPVVARGLGRKQPVLLTVELEPDVAEMFPDAVAVNEALRFLIRITKSSTAQMP